MNRKEFFKKLGLGTLVVYTAPACLNKVDPSRYIAGCDPISGSSHCFMVSDGKCWRDGQLIANTYLESIWSAQKYYHPTLSKKKLYSTEGIIPYLEKRGRENTGNNR